MIKTHHSEYLKLEKVYIKSAKNAFKSEELLEKQWKELNYLSKPDLQIGLKEYHQFESIFKENDVEVYQFPVNKNVKMDSIYCRDASIATDFGMII